MSQNVIEPVGGDASHFPALDRSFVRVRLLGMAQQMRHGFGVKAFEGVRGAGSRVGRRAAILARVGRGRRVGRLDGVAEIHLFGLARRLFVGRLIFAIGNIGARCC